MKILDQRMGGDVQLLGVMGEDREIAEAAWTSTDACEGRSEEDVARVVRFLARSNPIHWRPFATGGMVKIRIRCPSFVWDQWRRHHIGITRLEAEDFDALAVMWQEEADERGYNSESRRYVDSPPSFMPAPLDFWRKRSKGKKSGSSEEPLSEADAVQQALDRGELLAHFERYYAASLARGVSPEQARMDIPRTYISSHIEVGSIYAYARICQHRIHPEAEGPIRPFAKAVDEMLRTAFPVAWTALMDRFMFVPKKES